ncbi:MAG: G8 domain-containing protein, partial [Actinomycetota bacterium]
MRSPRPNPTKTSTRPARTARLATASAALALLASACVGPLAESGAQQASGGHDHAGAEHGCAGAHEGDPARASEHCAALALADPASATHVAVSSGSWSAPATWADGRVPDDGAAVHVPEGLEVTVDGDVAAVHDTVRLDGTLRFATDADTTLRVDTLVSSPGSVLEVGTPDQPVDAAVTATIEV